MNRTSPCSVFSGACLVFTDTPVAWHSMRRGLAAHVNVPESNLDLVQPTWHSEYPISVTKQPSSGGKVSSTFRNHGGDCKRFCRHIRTSRGPHQVFTFAGLAAGPEIRLLFTGKSSESSEKRSDQRVSVPQMQCSSLADFTESRLRTDSLEETYLPLARVQSTTGAIERVFDCKQIRPRNTCID